MYLIDAKTYELKLFVGDEIPEYVILSHTWEKEEVIFQDMRDLRSARKKEGFKKIRFTCQQALDDGLSYAWVDTCCINKESSAELSEAINSMFKWYRWATRCYAYLSDLTLVDHVITETHPPFKDSRWFTRGWTLQELIAPFNVLFMDQSWQLIGGKQDMLDALVDITGIDREALSDEYGLLLPKLSIAKRMSWAAERYTTREEDEAYCLLGLFDINMPLLYGEGGKAFERLQEELIRKTTDHSLFAHNGRFGRLLALSPREFAHCGDIIPCEGPYDAEPFDLTNVGLQIKLPMLHPDDGDRWTALAVLDCHRDRRRLTLPLEKSASTVNSRTWSRQPHQAIVYTHIEELVGCPAEEVMIARLPNVEAFRADWWFNTIWLYAASRIDKVRVRVTRLEPRESWNVGIVNDGLMRSHVEKDTVLASLVWDSLRPKGIGGKTLCHLTGEDVDPLEFILSFQLCWDKPKSRKQLCLNVEMSQVPDESSSSPNPSAQLQDYKSPFMPSSGPPPALNLRMGQHIIKASFYVIAYSSAGDPGELGAERRGEQRDILLRLEVDKAPAETANVSRFE